MWNILYEYRIHRATNFAIRMHNGDHEALGSFIYGLNQPVFSRREMFDLADRISPGLSSVDIIQDAIFQRYKL